MEDIINIDSDVAVIHGTADDDTVNSGIEEKGRNSDDKEEEEHVKEMMHKPCIFPEVISVVHILHGR